MDCCYDHNFMMFNREIHSRDHGTKGDTFFWGGGDKYMYGHIMKMYFYSGIFLLVINLQF